MKKLYTFIPWVVLVLLSIVAAACSPVQAAISQPTAIPPTAAQASTPTQSPTAAPALTATPASTPTQAAYSEPFSYCTAVGTIDQPDARYTGPKVPDVIIQGFIKAAGLSGTTEPTSMFQQTTIWRCMDKQVYVCNFGANLPCDSKADTDKTPTQAMADYCKANQDSEFIPMSVTGHATIYSWHCVKDAPQLLAQIDQVDAEGYIQQIWYKIEPGS